MHWALLETAATAPHVPIVVPPLSKLTAPVAPAVSVAVKVTDAPYVEDVGFAASVVEEVARLTLKAVADELTAL
jgi:hypothetical protein